MSSSEDSHRQRVGPSAVSRWSIVGLIVALLAADQLSKQLVARPLAGRPPRVLIEGALALQYAENHGIAFSILGPAPLAIPLLAALTAATILLVLLGWQRLPHKRPVDHFGFALVAAGALGNLLDRALFGYVVDFIRFEGMPVFNLADLMIGVGLGVLLFAPLRPRPGGGPGPPR